MTAVVVALAVAVLLLAVLVAGLLRSHAEILRALHELGAGLELDREAGGPVPVAIEGISRPAAPRSQPTPLTVEGHSLDGAPLSLPLAGAGDTLIAFLSSGCTTCQGFWQAFRSGVSDVPGGARLLVVTRGADEESPGALRDRAPRSVPLVLSTSAWDGFSVPGSPYFVYVDGTGRVVGEGSGGSWPQVATLLEQSRSDDASRRAVAGQRSGNGAARQSRDEDALLAAGIAPGDPSLYAGSP